MSTDGPPTAETAALNQQIEAVLRESTALSEALARTRTARRVLFLAILVFVVVVSWVFYNFFSQFMDPKTLDRLAQTAQKRLTDKSDDYMKEVNHLVEHATPILNEAVTKQVKNDMPEYVRALESQRDQFASTIQEQLNKKIDQHYKQLVDQQQQILREEFPLIKDEETHKRMAANLNVVFEKMVKKYYITEMEGQVKSLYSTWDEFPAAPKPAANQPSLEDQLISNLLELLKHRLSHGEGVALR
jgi:hypothetical protein